MNILKKAGALALVGAMTLSSFPIAAVEAKEDSEVSNTAGYSTDVIYQIVTDRFLDGDSSNNPSGAIFDRYDMMLMMEENRNV